MHFFYLKSLIISPQLFLNHLFLFPLQLTFLHVRSLNSQIYVPFHSHYQCIPSFILRIDLSYQSFHQLIQLLIFLFLKPYAISFHIIHLNQSINYVSILDYFPFFPFLNVIMTLIICNHLLIKLMIIITKLIIKSINSFNLINEIILNSSLIFSFILISND